MEQNTIMAQRSALAVASAIDKVAKLERSPNTAPAPDGSAAGEGHPRWAQRQSLLCCRGTCSKRSVLH
jgi:hypothetical protein